VLHGEGAGDSWDTCYYNTLTATAAALFTSTNTTTITATGITATTYYSKVIRALQGSFTVWVPPFDSPALKSTIKELRAGKLPYLAIVHLGEKTRKLSVKSIHHFKVRKGGREEGRTM